jgi:small subunit ribosomal protein S8
MFNCTIADGITRIRNGYKARLKEIELVFSNFMLNFLRILKSEGYIEDYEVFQEGNKKTIGVVLKYVRERGALREIKCISRPGQRIYTKKDKVPVIKNYLGCVILSTNKGLMSSKEAKSHGLGGEIVATVF